MHPDDGTFQTISDKSFFIAMDYGNEVKECGQGSVREP